MAPKDPVREVSMALILFIYIMFIVFLSKKIFEYMKTRNLRYNVIIYYNRKIIHILAGGVVAFTVPYLFTSPIVPTLLAVSIGILLYIPRRKNKLMNWFQVSDNAYEVNFCFAWGLSLLAVWLIKSNVYYAIVPPLFMAIGDAVTGIVRNRIYGERTKSWIGNLAMLIATIPIGIYYAGTRGLIAAVVSTIIEHFEFPPLLDDNVLIALSSTLVLIIP